MNTAISENISERVAKGAAFLDDHDPGWDEHIVLPKLDLRSCLRCVLGQRYRSFGRALNILGIEGPRAVALGFDRCGDDGDSDAYPVLTSAWKTLISERRSAS